MITYLFQTAVEKGLIAQRRFHKKSVKHCSWINSAVFNSKLSRIGRPSDRQLGLEWSRSRSSPANVLFLRRFPSPPPLPPGALKPKAEPYRLYVVLCRQVEHAEWFISQKKKQIWGDLLVVKLPSKWGCNWRSYSKCTETIVSEMKKHLVNSPASHTW